MGKESKSKLTLVHLVLMVLLCIISVVSAVIIFTGNIPSGFETSKEMYRATTTLYGVAHVVNAIALMCGITYLLKGSGKSAAIWYKALVMLVTLGVTLRLIGTLIHPGFGAASALMIGIVLALLVLGFVKDLGKTRSWCVFYILLALEVALAIVMFDKNEVMSSIVGNLSRLVLDGTIGLALREKYADKAERKTN